MVTLDSQVLLSSDIQNRLKHEEDEVKYNACVS
jgi:hypothetical protein